MKYGIPSYGRSVGDPDKLAQNGTTTLAASTTIHVDHIVHNFNHGRGIFFLK